MFTIEIVEETVEERQSGHKWERGGPIDATTHSPGEDSWGYTPRIMQPTKVEKIILRQEVKELDLAAVIKAINKL